MSKHRNTETAFDYSKYGVIVITEAANSEIMSYEKALKSLDAGQYDHDLFLGFELVLTLSLMAGKRAFMSQTMNNG
ncbi:hypothetical protein [Xenorhabdus bovienii]|uniref:Uncharacterized protein n=1 Tax=Xenorhabdus bovienii str. feltiae Moldova TaxID=1398200 RepID=A0A077NF29_XENBV|nr:hypothetical protein [Xenorhabdus bovienii]CDH00742.1 conserved hypothetical protein [Xenorhabdus bovienii str. feltiae Moldova]